MANEKRDVPEGSYVLTHWWMKNKMNMTPNERNIFACIYGFSLEENSYYTGSAQYLADWADVSRRTVMTCLKSLVDKGYIIKKDYYENNEKKCHYKALHYTKIESIKETENCLKNTQEGVKNFHRGCEKISHNKDINKDNYKDNYRGDTNKQIIDPNEVIKIYKTICISLPHIKRVTRQRKEEISKLLSIYTLDEIKEAFIKANASHLLNGKKDGRKVGIDWLLKEDNITKLLEGNYDNKTKGRIEQLPKWMHKDQHNYDYEELEASILANGSSERTVTNDPALQARADNLRKSLVGG